MPAYNRLIVEWLTLPHAAGHPKRDSTGLTVTAYHWPPAGVGTTERELEAIFGRSGGRMATFYTKSANRSRLAAGAIGKLDRATTENRTTIPSPSAEVRAGNRNSQ